jgi:hypothetical protein
MADQLPDLQFDDNKLPDLQFDEVPQNVTPQQQLAYRREQTEQSIKDFLKGAAQGAGNVLLRGGELISDIPGFEKLNPIPENARFIPNNYQLNFAPQNTAAKIGGFTGQMAALAPLGEVAPELAPELAAARPLLTRTLSGAAQGAILSPLLTKPGQSVLGSSAIGAATGGPFAALTGMFPKLLASKSLPTSIVPQVKDNIQKTLQGISDDIVNKAGGDLSNIHHDIFDLISDYRDELLGNKPENEMYNYINPSQSASALYDKAAALGHSAGAIYDPQSYLDKIEDVKDDLKQQINQAGSGSTTADENKKILNLIESDFTPRENSNDLSKLKLENYNDADYLKRVLNYKWMQALQDKDKKLQNVIGELKDGVRDSIKDSFGTSPEAGKTLQQADNQYSFIKKTFDQTSANKPTTIFQLLQKSDPHSDELMDKFMSKYISPGQTKDQVNAMQNLKNMIPNQEGWNKVVGWYFKDANTPNQFMAKYNSLGQNQRQLLFSGNPDTYNKLEVLNRLYNKNKDLFTQNEKAAPFTVARRIGETIAAAGATAMGHPLIGLGLAAEPAGLALSRASTAINPSLIPKYIAGNLNTNPNIGLPTRLSIYGLSDLFNNLMGKGGNK